jgi:Carboxypeptidase regulatory-like domain/TonB-dependent Receptor Plug Domain
MLAASSAWLAGSNPVKRSQRARAVGRAGAALKREGQVKYFYFVDSLEANKKMRRTKAALALFFFLLGCGWTAAQSISGSITGTVVDPKGLAIPGATVVLTNVATSVQLTATSNEEGRFEFLSLLPGTYDLTVEITGFKKLVRAGNVLSATQRLATGPLTLDLGGVQESVMVSGRVEAVQTVSGERSGLITRQQLDNLQTFARDPLELWAKLPGIITDGAGNAAFQTPHAIREISVMGGRRNNKNVTIDGLAAMNTVTNQALSVTPSIDSVEEVQVLLSNYQAEYGRNAGAGINIITRSGSRDFHGSVSFYMRHENLNAASFFDNKFGRTKPLSRTQTRGLTIGGPAYIPGMFNVDKKKLFFFFSTSQQPFKLPPPLHQIQMPTELERQGDFSQSFAQNGSLITVRDPQTGQPFPGNRIPSNRLEPLGVQLLNIFPMPNTSDPQRRWNYQQSGLQYRQPRRSEVIRLDYNLSDHYTLMGRYVQDKNDIITDYFSNFSLGETRLSRPGKNVLLRFNQVLSPSLVNESSFGYNRLLTETGPEDDAALAAFQRATYGITLSQLRPENNPQNLLPNINFGAPLSGQLAPALTNAFGSEFVQHFTVGDNLSKNFTNHILKFGLYFERGITNSLPTPPPTGTTGVWNGGLNFAVDANNPNDTGYPYANAVLGNFRTYTEPTIRREADFRFSNLEWYGQDNWRVNRKLTFEYGLRFYWHPPEFESDDFMSSASIASFDRSKAVRLYLPAPGNQGRDPVTGATVPRVLVGSIVPGSGDLSNGIELQSQGDLVDDRGIHLAPRFGFAYDLAGDGKTAIRGGFGIFYDRLSNAVLSRLAQNAPLVLNPTVFNSNLNGLLGASGAVFPSDLFGIGNDGRLATAMNYSLGVQRRIGAAFAVDVAYVASLSRHLAEGRDYNTLPPAARFLRANEDPTLPGRALADPFLRPYQGYNQILMTEMSGNSNYHSMQAGLTRRFGDRFNFDVNYTWARALNYTANDNALRSVLLPGGRDYGRADIAANHVFNANYIYQIPNLSPHMGGNKFVKAIFDDWRISGVTQYMSGYPVGIALAAPGQDFTGSNELARVNVTGPVNLPKDERTLSRHFDTSAITRPIPGAFGVTLPANVDYGSASKDVFNQPGFNMWNASVTKVIRIHENHRFQISAEFYNLPNHTQFRRANNTAQFNAAGVQTNPQFGEYISDLGPRQIQLGIRYDF